MPRADFESDEPADPAWVVPRALRHELLIEKMASHGPILPVRFGALFSTPDALAAWMSLNHEAITRFLDHVAGKEEWTLKVNVETGTSLRDLDRARSRRGRTRRGDCRRRPGTRYFHEKRLRDEAQASMSRRERARDRNGATAARALAEERVLAPTQARTARRRTDRAPGLSRAPRRRRGSFWTRYAGCRRRCGLFAADHFRAVAPVALLPARWNRHA